MTETRSALLAAGQLTTVGWFKVYAAPAATVTILKYQQFWNEDVTQVAVQTINQTSAGQWGLSDTLTVPARQALRLDSWTVIPGGWGMWINMPVVGLLRYWLSGAVLAPAQPYPVQAPQPALAMDQIEPLPTV